MNTLIAWRLPPLCTLATLALLYGLARGLLRDIRAFAAPRHLPGINGDAIAATGLWLFCLTGVLAFGSPASLTTRTVSVLMLSMLLRLAVCDALTGLLPRRETLLFLVVGMFAVGVRDITALPGTALTALFCFILHRVINHRQENLGRGDLFLLTGLTAWAGPLATLFIGIAALAAFILWHNTWRVGGRIEGPLGPWLCLTAATQQLLFLFQPLWISP